MRHHRQLARVMMSIRVEGVWRFCSPLDATFRGHALQRLAWRAGFSETARMALVSRQTDAGRSQAEFGGYISLKGMTAAAALDVHRAWE
jgi:hypothetical protein